MKKTTKFTRTRGKAARFLGASLDAHPVTDEAWWYETTDGIIVVAQLRKGGLYQGTTQTRITWRQLLLAAKRCGRVGVAPTERREPSV